MENEPLKDRAIRYVRAGMSVIPVGPDKRPLVAWKEFQDRYVTEPEIEEWFKKFPDAQLGIVTGKISQLLVVDVEAGGDASFLPQETTVIKTGGGGWHYYFAYEPGFANKARIRELVDIRADGGYVVAPGSTSSKGPYSIVKRLPLCKFPSHLFKFDGGANNGQSGAVSTPSGPSNYDNLDDYPGFGPGERNSRLAAHIGKLVAIIHPSEWETTAFDFAKRANSRNAPPLNERELRTTFDSIKNTEKRNHSDRWTTQPPIADTGAAWKTSSDDDSVNLMSAVAASQAINIDDIYPTGVTVFDETFFGGFAPGDLVIIAGKTGEGKTTLSQDFTMRLFEGPRKASVLWFSYEVMPAYLWRKFQAMGAKDTDSILIPAKHTTGNVEWVHKKIKEAKEKFGTKIVVIDHLGFLMPRVIAKGVSTNYSNYLTAVVRDIKTIAVSEEIIIVMPVHVRKTDSPEMDDIKDSSGIAQEADLVFLIERERASGRQSTSYYTEMTKITLSKNRKTGQTVTAWFSMIDGRFIYDATYQRMTATKDEIRESKKTAASDFNALVKMANKKRPDELD